MEHSRSTNGIDRAVLVPEQLDLDVPGLHDPTFEVDGAVAKGGTSFRARGRNGAKQVLGRFDRPHALATATRHRFDDERITHLGAGSDNLRVGGIGGERLLGPRHHRHARLDRHFAGAGLTAHHRDDFRGWADEGQAGIATRSSKAGVLGEKTIARVDGVRTTALRRIDDPFDPQIAFSRGARADVNSLIRLAHMPRITIAVGIDRDRRDAHLAAGANDPDGDLSPVGDEDFHIGGDRKL